MDQKRQKAPRTTRFSNPSSIRSGMIGNSSVGNPSSLTERLAFLLDGVDDYISGDTVVGRTGYNADIAGNIITGSDGDGSYMWINGNYRRDLATGTPSNITSSPITINQSASFCLKVKFKIVAFSTDNNTTGLFASASTIGIYLGNNTGLLTYRIRNGGTFTDATTTIAINTLYDAYLVYDQPTNKLYAYLSTSGGASVLLNSGGTTVTAGTFGGALAYLIGDGGIAGGNSTSCSKYIYHCAIRNRALTQSEINADITLSNTTKSDPTIIAYYIPENIQYNTQYIANSTDFNNASRTKTGTTITTGQADLNGGTNAQTLTISAGAGNGATSTNNTVTGSGLASKTFKIKVFAWTSSGSATIRLKISHNGVATYYSSDQTVTTTPQQFTFTQAFTSSTSGTGVTYGVEVGSGAGAATIIGYKCTGWLIDETLRDESPNIGGYIGWKTSHTISLFIKPGADGVNSANSQPVFFTPYFYLHIRDTTNTLNIRYDSSRIPSGSFAGSYSLGNGFRDMVHIACVISFSGGTRTLKLYTAGVLRATATTSVGPPTSFINASTWLGRKSGNYYTGYARKPKVHVGNVSDADVAVMATGGEPASAVLYQNWGPNRRGGLMVSDLSGNGRSGTEVGGIKVVKRPVS